MAVLERVKRGPFQAGPRFVADLLRLSQPILGCVEIAQGAEHGCMLRAPVRTQLARCIRRKGAPLHKLPGRQWPARSQEMAREIPQGFWMRAIFAKSMNVVPIRH